jgi:hypothetical protein
MGGLGSLPGSHFYVVKLSTMSYPPQNGYANHCDAKRSPREITRDLKATETGADDDDMMSGVNCHSRVRSLRSGIDDHPAGLNGSARSEASRLQAARPHDVEDGFAASDKIIGDNAPMASPPHSFRAHDRAAPFASLFE